ncbi:ATP-binding protein [Cnuibacter physcomitrellae]|uniref:sensor histidine kinase n=1 Tax=Cnuibacter physcomitrellae TaxID=1619308 RepID=UPI0021761B0A|nr:ATP-binding protein [Cnuibacter physcomitrellae]MCS5497728.1 ATP-binding protein [Cnuibacter physcomitrellae]
MPLFEMEATPRGRRRVSVLAQLPLLLGSAFVTGLVALSLPHELLSPTLLTGLALIVMATALAVALPWERWNPNTLIAVAVIDIVGIALIRAELLDQLPSVGILAIFPVLWLAYGFRPWAMAVAIGGALVITSFPFVFRGRWPTNALEWSNVVLLPALIVGVAIVVNLAAAQLRRNRQRLVESMDAQAAMLRLSQDSELLSRAIIDTVNAGIAFYAADARLVVANRQAADMARLAGFELERPPYAGDDVLMADRETTIPYDQQIIPRALRAEEIADHVEWVGPADEQIAIMASSRRVHRPDGELLGTVIVAYDITELAQAIEVREAFLSTVSHELRTPLTNITGYLDLLEDSIDPADSESASYLRVVLRNAAELRDRIDELLAATSTTSPLALEPSDVGAVLDRAVAALHDRARSREQRIHVVRDPTADTSARADRERLQRALEEIIDNAVKFGPVGSTITVTETVMPSSIAITVEDSGPGISRGEQTRIFDRFYRTPYAHHNAIQGFGLGLTLAKSTVAAHEGRISVRSTGAGTALTTTIPRSGPADAV